MDYAPSYANYEEDGTEYVVSLKPTDYRVFSKEYHICVFIENDYQYLNMQDIYDLSCQLQKLSEGEDTGALAKILKRFEDFEYAATIPFRSPRDRKFR